MKFSVWDFKHARLILQEMKMLREIEEIIRQIKIPKLGRGVKPTPSELIQIEFVNRGWQKEYHFKEGSRLAFDLYKNKVAIEIQLSDPADCYNDYLKFLLAYNLEKIEVGVEIVYDNNVRGSNLPKISKVQNDLETYKRIIPCPILVIGLKK